MDFETSGLEHYRDDFRILSMALAWRVGGEMKLAYYEGEKAIRRSLERIRDRGGLLVAHNAPFELGCLYSRFPDLYKDLQWEADTMRLVQVGDNGLPDGLSLQACVKRWLPEARHNHKEPYYLWLRENMGVKKGKEGAALDLLPPDMIRSYNEYDAIVTLELYETVTNFFKDINYDWTLDHQLYFSTARLVAESKARGILVDRTMVGVNITVLHSEISEIKRNFISRFSIPVCGVEQRLREKRLSKYKTERGRLNASLDDCVFNLGSTHHLASMFMDELGIEPIFRTEKGAPSFAKSDLHQWGEGGKMLERVGSLGIALRQLESLSTLAEDDGRWHLDLQVCGTTTGRLAGGSGNG